jgi:hypothetical protein
MTPVREKLRNKVVVIALLVIVIVAICSVLYWTQLTMQQNETKEMKEMKEELPLAVQKELDNLKEEKSFTVIRWESDATNRTIVLYVVEMSKEQLNTLQEKKIDNWTVTAVPDTEYITRMEAARSELMRLEQDPKMQIAGFSMEVGPGENNVNMWVYNRTPENQELNGKEIHGWTVHVWVALTPTEAGTNRC